MTTERSKTTLLGISPAAARDQAKAVFDALKDRWQTGLEDANAGKTGSGFLWDDFWKGGNTLDAAVDYFVETGEKGAESFVRQSLQFFRRVPYPSGHWRDDWGWWGNAFVNAHTNAMALRIEDAEDLESGGTLAQECLDAAVYCWRVLAASAYVSWAFIPHNSDVGEGFAAWNNGGVDEYAKDPKNYGPTPNTVTNVGFWALSLGLHQATSSSEDNKFNYLAVARQTFDWLYNLKFHGLITNGRNLISETPNPNAHPGWCKDPKRAWTADQGVVMYCCLKMRAIETDEARRAHLLEVYEMLAKGFLDGTNTLVDANGVLIEYDTDPPEASNQSNFSNYNDNYCTGPGVLARYVTRSLPLMPEREAQGYFRELFATSAKSAWAQREAPKSDIRNWDNRPFEQTKYATYFSTTANRDIWLLAFQASALDLFNAQLQISRTTGET